MTPLEHSAATAAVVDALGKVCPLPVIELSRVIDTLDLGSVVLVLADDPGARVDIPVWCMLKSQQLLAVETSETGWRFRVRKTA